MEKITSFTIDHNKLQKGIYVSRIDEKDGAAVTTFDIRMTLPNREPVMETGGIHALEHLGATFLRNHSVWAKDIVYFGPMGCRTGFYLVVWGKHDSKDMISVVREMFEFCAEFEGEVPGASAKDCGNYTDIDLATAKRYADNFLKTLRDLKTENLVYPS